MQARKGGQSAKAILCTILEKCQISWVFLGKLRWAGPQTGPRKPMRSKRRPVHTTRERKTERDKTDKPPEKPEPLTARVDTKVYRPGQTGPRSEDGGGGGTQPLKPSATKRRQKRTPTLDIRVQLQSRFLKGRHYLIREPAFGVTLQHQTAMNTPKKH